MWMCFGSSLGRCHPTISDKGIWEPAFSHSLRAEVQFSNGPERGRNQPQEASRVSGSHTSQYCSIHLCPIDRRRKKRPCPCSELTVIPLVLTTVCVYTEVLQTNQEMPTKLPHRLNCETLECCNVDLWKKRDTLKVLKYNRVQKHKCGCSHLQFSLDS